MCFYSKIFIFKNITKVHMEPEPYAKRFITSLCICVLYYGKTLSQLSITLSKLFN